MTGWNLPPGVETYMIPGNRPEDSMDTNSFHVILFKKKETKGTWVYQADDPEAPIQTLYIRKSGVTNLGSPQSVKVTLVALEPE